MPFSLEKIELVRLLLTVAGVGIVVGRLLAAWTEWETPSTTENQKRSWISPVPVLGSLWALLRNRGHRFSSGGWILLVEIGTAALFAGFVWMMVEWQCQQVQSVVPSELARDLRVYYHLFLIALLIVASGTDFRDYIISDSVVGVGLLVGLVGAGISGEMQMIHVWIDWNNEIPLQGPYIPAWLDQHRHLHGLAWSAAGFVVGAGTTWILRVVSAWVLGQESLGFGDVTLMGMIGSFIGWQPIVLVWLLAPLSGIVVGLLVRIVTGRTFVPFGPYLSFSTLIVICTWRWTWPALKFIFGHPATLAMLGGGTLGALVLLLGMLRVYRAIPVTRRTVGETQPVESADELEPPSA